ncbi:MAG: hypothetical protein ABSD96_09955 [Candidatus Korobacteraceae bacterium]|jgi:hypothetical protein
MKNLLHAASVLLLAGAAMAQSGAMNSMSASTNQNQTLTGLTAHPFPPAPGFSGGAPDAGDRVSGTPANATTMHMESESMTAGQITPPAADDSKLAQQAIFEGADQGSARATKRTQR